MENLKVLLTLSLVLLCAKARALEGGEIGNGRYVEYKNLISRFKIEIPKKWDYFGAEDWVDFLDEEVSKTKISIIRSTHNLSLEELKNSLKESCSNAWTQLEGLKYPALHCTEPGRSFIVFYSSPKVYAKVILPVPLNVDEEKDQNHLLNSMRFREDAGL